LSARHERGLQTIIKPGQFSMEIPGQFSVEIDSAELRNMSHSGEDFLR
jgi:hypothetical protein